ncbi:hypothetical protein IAT38_005737 [Cryptococcus sp. DSM 104549]
MTNPSLRETQPGNPNKPRPLTPDEIHQAWFGAGPSSQQATQDDYKLRTTYPAVRVAYELTSPGADVDEQILRVVKRTAWEELCQNVEGKHSESSAAHLRSRFSLEEGWSVKFLDAQIEEADRLREAANLLYRKGDFENALRAYAKAWSSVVPWYPQALSRDDPLRWKLGLLETTIFANMAATCIALAEKTSDERDKRRIRRQGFKYAWVVVHGQEGARVKTLKNACTRAASLIDSIVPDGELPPEAADAFKRTHSYLEFQVAIMANAKDETLVRDVDRGRTLARPGLGVLKYVGPRAWEEAAEVTVGGGEAV